VDFRILSDENLSMFAMRVYDNPHCVGEKEFYNDLKLFRHIRRLATRYANNHELSNVRLILNHIITCMNVFGTAPSIRLMFYKTKSPQQEVLKAFLVYLDRCPDIVKGVPYDIDLRYVEEDLRIISLLREMQK
jgi:hypothetical protein